MSKAHAEMVDRLRQSVAEIMKSDVPNRDELLNKSFDEYAEAVAEADEIEAEEAEAEEAEDYEGEDEAQDPVVVFADAVADADEALNALIEAGEIDEETAMLLAQWSAMSDIGLRALANTRAYPVEEDEMDEVGKSDGVYEMALSKADGDDEGPDSVLVKTDLPERVAQFITDPQELAEAYAQVAFGAAEMTGLPLAKFDPETGEEQAPEPQGSEALIRQLQVMMRLSAATLVQGEAILRGIGGGGEEGEMDEAGEEEAPEEEVAEGEGEMDEAGDEEAPEEETAEKPAEEPAEEEEEEAPAKGKPPAFLRRAHDAEDLRKSITAEFNGAVEQATAPLKKALEEANAQLKQLAKQPAPAKAPLFAMTKAADNGGAPQEDHMARLAGMSESERTTELMKMVHKAPFAVNN
jgi:hypothetical protein